MKQLKEIDLGNFIRELIAKEKKQKEVKKTNSDFQPIILFDISN